MPPPDTNSRTALRPAVRGSLLSRLQSGMVADWLVAKHPGLQIERITITTSGDTIQDRPLHEFGGKGLFTKELEQALLCGEVDFAVHSYKDVPVTMPLVDTAELVIAASPVREDPRDVLACRIARSLAELPKGAKVGTGSLRRGAQVLALRPDLVVMPIRGNVDTRIRKLLGGEYDAVILALAGTRRAGLFDAAFMTPIDPAVMLPAAGQGALAIQCRRDDSRCKAILESLNDPATANAVKLERQIVLELNGDCHSPIAALATMSDDTVTLQAAVARRDGRPPVIRASASVAAPQADTLPQLVISQLKDEGALAMLAGVDG